MTDYSRQTLSLPSSIETRRLTLRVAAEADHDSHWRMDSDDEVMRYVGPKPSDFAEHRRRFLEALSDGTRFKFLRMLSRTGDAKTLGWVFLRPTEDGRWLELGYRLLPEAWGQGYVPEASRALIDHAFKVWQASEAMALIMPQNRKSQRVVEKLGFSLRGTTSDYYDESLELWVLSADDACSSEG